MTPEEAIKMLSRMAAPYDDDDPISLVLWQGITALRKLPELEARVKELERRVTALEDDRWPEPLIRG